MLSACAEYEDFKSLYSMLPYSKSGRTLSKGTRSMRLAPPHSPYPQQTDGLKGQNTSAQGNALGINTLPTIAQNGQKNYPVYLPFASAVVVGCHSFATFGATI